jgi:hypothetical protein
VSSDSLNDSWWDNVLDWVNQNAEWLKVVKDILTVVTAIVGVLSIFFPVLAPIALGLAVLSMGLSFLLASSGDGSWFDFALDAIGVLTFGVGSALAGINSAPSPCAAAARPRRGAQPGMVWGNGARQVIGNLLDRGLVGSIRQPMRMVAEESASVLSARPNFAQVVTHWGDDAMKGIRESDSIIISEFDQIASQARLGAGGAIDNLVTSGVDSLKESSGRWARSARRSTPTTWSESGSTAATSWSTGFRTRRESRHRWGPSPPASTRRTDSFRGCSRRRWGRTGAAPPSHESQRRSRGRPASATASSSPPSSGSSSVHSRRSACWSDSS